MLSRSTLFRLEPLTPVAIWTLLARAMADPDRGLGADGLTLDDDAAEHVAERAEGDARHALTALEVAAALALDAGRASISLADAEAALSLRAR